MLLLKFDIEGRQDFRRMWILHLIRTTDKVVDIGGHDGHIFNGTSFDVTTVDLDLFDIPKFVRADAADLPFEDKSFDVAVMAEILEHVEDPIQCLKEAKRVASSIVITVPNEYEWIKEYNPFGPRYVGGETHEEWKKRVIREQNDVYPLLREIDWSDEGMHLGHNRYYTKELLEYHLSKAGLFPLFCYQCNYSGWSFFFVYVNC
jgi:SAM-dependent methyltransferase